MGEALVWRQIVHQRGHASSGRSSLALVMAQWSWSLAGGSLRRVCPQSQCCKELMVWTLDSSQLVLIKGDLSGASHDHLKGLFSGECIDFSIYPAVLSKLSHCHHTHFSISQLPHPLNRLKVLRE